MFKCHEKNPKDAVNTRRSQCWIDVSVITPASLWRAAIWHEVMHIMTSHMDSFTWRSVNSHTDSFTVMEIRENSTMFTSFDFKNEFWSDWWWKKNLISWKYQTRRGWIVFDRKPQDPSDRKDVLDECWCFYSTALYIPGLGWSRQIKNVKKKKDFDHF